MFSKLKKVMHKPILSTGYYVGGFAPPGFTMIELVVSITILSVIMLSVFEIYNNILQVNKRLEAMRIIQENVRNITEQIASDVREKGIDFHYYDDSSILKTNNYTGSGNQILAIQGGDRYYTMKDGIGGATLCTESEQQDLKIHCYIGKEDVLGNRKALSDDRARIEHLHFFLSGNTGRSLTNNSQEGKVTVNLKIGIEKKVGVTSEVAKSAHMLMQTTISEKVYKKN